MHMLNENEGIVVGDSGIIFTTKDGGKTWTKRNAGTTYPLYGVVMSSSTEIIIVGGNQNYRIYHTYDGGVTRNNRFITQQSKIFYPRLSKIVKLNDRSYLAVGSVYSIDTKKTSGSTYYSNDSGITWTQMHTFTIGALLTDATFINEKEGVIIGIDNLNLKTNNSGSNWNAMGNMPMSRTLNSVYMESLTKMVISTNNGELFSSTDGGTTWKTETIKDKYSLNKIFVNSTNGNRWIAADDDIFILQNAVPNLVEEVNKEKLMIYPNPANQTRNVKLNERALLKIYSILGEVVYQALFTSGEQRWM